MVQKEIFDGLIDSADAIFLDCKSIQKNYNAESSFAKLLDLTMMVLPGGKERTAFEYQRLQEGSGFAFTQNVPTSCDVSIIEGRKIG